ncbi:MAG: divergent polysaccharide deacetylase family protein [Marinovum sp.]|nr:divergent polysaccharide deacetylase family protein [Marinovum sp.]
MARSFLSGVFWGVVASTVTVGAASVVTGPVMAPSPDAADASPRTVAPPAAPDVPPENRLTRPTVTTEVETESPGLPSEPASSNSPDVESASAPVPVTGDIAAAPQVPDSARDVNVDPQIASDDGVPVDAQVSGVAQPQAPATDALADVDATPAPAPEPQVVEMTEPEVAEAVTEVQVPQEQDKIVLGTEELEEPATPRLPQATAPEQESLAVVEAAPEVVTTEEQESETVAALSPGLGSGASDFSKLNPSVTTSRLPSLGDVAESEKIAPIVAYASAPAALDDRARMSIVLIDDGSVPLGLEALEAFPYPLTFAVDTEWTGATDAMARYRAAGFEVMALANLPAGAAATDVAVALSAALDVVPEAVAVLEGDGDGLQGDRAISDQVSDILAQSGHGLVLYPKGLNTGVSLAQRAGVPSQALFRDFDGQGQTASVIRRFLDQAAFKANQEGSVIMVGRLRAETISALLVWGLQDRASRVALVPISTVLRGLK